MKLLVSILLLLAGSYSYAQAPPGNGFVYGKPSYNNNSTSQIDVANYVASALAGGAALPTSPPGTLLANPTGASATPVAVTLGTNLSFSGTVLNATGGSSGVTSVGLTDASTSPIFTISNSPVTTTGTLTETLSNESANSVFAGPTSGGAGQPTFRSLVIADIPTIPSTQVSGLGTFATQSYASPPAIGGTTPAAGSFSTLSASSTVSGAGFSNYLSSPPAIGNTTPSTGAFTTLSASSTVSGAGFLNYLASPPAIGATTPAAGSFTNLTVTGTTTIPGQQTTVLQSSLPFIYGPSGYLTATGTYVIGQAPSASATASFSATSGTGVTMTMSAATLLGTASDVGRVLTILDTTYKYATITAFTSTTVATVTITGTLSGTGAFANNAIWMSGTAQSLSNTVSFGSPLPAVYASGYFYVPASSAIGVAEWVYGTCASTTVCTLYNNAYTSGTPVIPGSPTAFSGLTANAFTQTVSSFILGPAYTVAANALGLEGGIEGDMLESAQNSASNKIIRCQYGGNNFGQNSATANTTNLLRCRFRNAGVSNVQTAVYENTGNSSAITISTPIHLTVASSSSQTAGIYFQNVSAYDYSVIESFSVVLKPF